MGSSAIRAMTNFVQIGERKIAYRSIGKGLPIIMVNRFRGTLDTWDPAFLDSLASEFNVITIDYTGEWIINRCMRGRRFFNGKGCQGCC